MRKTIKKQTIRKHTYGYLGVKVGVCLLWGTFFVFLQSDLLYSKNRVAAAGSRKSGTASGYSTVPARVILAKANPTNYEDTIKGIIKADCGRCHSGPTRNLMDYDSLKTYADTGLLATMVQGPMRRFAGNDVQTILDWVQKGAPEKSPAAQVRFGHSPAGVRARQGGQITYRNTIKTILAKDCLRCHSDAFRNLTTYKNVKMYVDNGLLQTLVLPGGPMHRFAGPDTRFIMAWIQSGALP